MTINSGGESCKGDGFIPIDHVINGVSGRKKRLLNPIMLRIKRERMYQLYDLQLVKAVNAEAREEVINYENTQGFKGCDTISSHPTCGFSNFNNKMIQFSEGFCCSCDQSVNDQRQPCEGHPGERKSISQLSMSLNRHIRSNTTNKETSAGVFDHIHDESDKFEDSVDEQEDETEELSSRESRMIQNGDIGNEPGFEKNFRINIDESFPLEEEKPAAAPIKLILHKTLQGIEGSPLKNINLEGVTDYEKNIIQSVTTTNKQEMAAEPLIFEPNVKNNFLKDDPIKDRVLIKYGSEVSSKDFNNVPEDSQHETSEDESSNERCENDNENQNITIKTFHFEHTFAPQEDPYTVSSIDITIESRDDYDEENCGKKNISSLLKPNCSNGVPQEKLRMLLMNKIKINKIDETIGETFNKMSSGSTKTTKTPCQIRSVNGESDVEQTPIIESSQNNDPESFSLRLAKEKSEINIKIVPKKRVEEDHYLKEETTFPNYNLEKMGIQYPKNQNQLISNNNSKSQFNLQSPSCGTTVSVSCKEESISPTSLSEDTTKPCSGTGNTQDRDSKHINAIENVVYKLVPLINSAQSGCGKPENDLNSSLQDSDNHTIEMLIELEKNKGSSNSSCSNIAVSFNLTSDKLLNNSIKLPDYNVLKIEPLLTNEANNRPLVGLKAEDSGGVRVGSVSKFEKRDNVDVKSQYPISEKPTVLGELQLQMLVRDAADQKSQHQTFEKRNNEKDSTLKAFDGISNGGYSNKNKRMVIQKVGVKKREACEKQIRGGQSCSKEGKVLPCNANPETYFESAHCLRFSDLWYNVHRLLNPRIENSITVKIYAKHRTATKNVCWENLTKRMPGKIGTSNEVSVDDSKNIIMYYSSDDKVAFSLDCSGDYLLVPQPLSKRCKSEELRAVGRGGPQEYLVLKENEIAFDTEDCDKAGVTYATFARQPHRCQREAGSCLKNQPLHFWREDKKAAEEKRQGQYFLGNFVTVPEQAILLNTTSNQVVLRVPYLKPYQSHVVVELNADNIEIIADRNEGQITEVYIDATSNKVTIVKAVITNMGIAADSFGVDFANCSLPLGPSDFDKPGRDEIPPQHRITYTATISSPNLHKFTECTLALYSVDHELVASRRIIIVKDQRCMCVWHCKCVCYDYPESGLRCSPLSLRDYNKAGFPGHLPVLVTSSFDCIDYSSVLQGLMWFFIILLFLGLIKAILGLCFSYVAVYGLNYVLPEEAKSLYCYMESSLADCPVVRDCDGFPIHPHTFKHTVHFLPWYSEFLLNIFFFICTLRKYLCSSCGRLKRFSNHQFWYHQMAGPNGNHNSCCYSPGHRSPCGSPCSSNRKRYRLHAGADEVNFDCNSPSVADDDIAERRVDNLIRSYTVYRNLNRPLGGVKSVPGTPYCVRGFFLQSENGVFEFSPPSPLMQVCQMDGKKLDSPVVLDPKPFHTTYQSAQDVLAARELSSHPRGVVINAL